MMSFLFCVCCSCWLGGCSLSLFFFFFFLNLEDSKFPTEQSMKNIQAISICVYTDLKFVLQSEIFTFCLID